MCHHGTELHSRNGIRAQEFRVRVTNDTHSRLPSDVYLLALGVTLGTFLQKLRLQLSA